VPPSFREQGLDGAVVERDRPQSAFGFRRLEPEPEFLRLLPGALDTEGFTFRVEIAPAQGQKFVASSAAGGGQRHDGKECRRPETCDERRKLGFVETFANVVVGLVSPETCPSGFGTCSTRAMGFTAINPLRVAVASSAPKTIWT
jgi:hypothetical protein